MAEQEKDQLERVGMANRFRFVAGQGVKMFSDTNSDNEEESDELMGEDSTEDGPEDGGGGAVEVDTADGADVFLAGIEETSRLKEGEISAFPPAEELQVRKRRKV